MSLRSLEYAATLIVEPLWAWFTAAMNVLTRRSFDEVLPQGLLKCAPGSGSQAAAVLAVTPVVRRTSAATAPSRLSMRGLFRCWFPSSDPAARAGRPVHVGGAAPVPPARRDAHVLFTFRGIPYGTAGSVPALGGGGLPSVPDRVLDVRRA